MNSGPFSGAVGLYDGFYGGFVGGHEHEHEHEHGFSQRLGASTSGEPGAADVQKRKGGGREEKAATALRSHSEAERRRRERINAHLATLRSMVPCTHKMDKAALLAEVINHVKKLKSDAARVGKHCPVPSGADEVTVEVVQQSQASPHHLVVKATLSCGDGCADLFADVRRALQPLAPRVVGSEVTTLGGRVRSVLLITAEEGEEADDEGGRVSGDGIDEECAASHRRHECIASVQEALRGVMDRRAACSNDTSSSGGGGGGSIKRQRMNYGAHEQCSA